MTVSYNVLDRYKGLPLDEIREDREKNSLPFAVLMMYVRYDINIGTVVRNANAFGAKEVFYYGPRRKWDRRGAIGAHHYIDVSHVRHLNDGSGYLELNKLRKSYSHWVALDILEGISKPLTEHQWKPGTLLVLGEEQCGIPREILYMCDNILEIPQRGTVRSINVGTASGIAMFQITQELG
jgi:tRNA G18 (ribose-2'-O)-methylase SpoU